MTEIECNVCHQMFKLTAEARVHKVNTQHRMTEFCWLMGSRREFMKIWEVNNYA